MAQGLDKEEKTPVKHLLPSEWRSTEGWLEYLDLSYAGIGLVKLIGALRDNNDTLLGQAPDGSVYLIPYKEDSFRRTTLENMQSDVLVYESDKRQASFTRVILDEKN